MRIKDVLRISLKNIRIYFKRNLIIMAVMGVIFGIVFAINLWFQGMENSYTELANQSTEGRVIIEATNSMEGMIIDDALPKTTRQEMSDKIVLVLCNFRYKVYYNRFSLSIHRPLILF